MHKIIHATTLAALAAATSLASSPAQATSDYKSFSTSMCRPLTGPDATGLVFDTRGVVNSTTVNKRVICSLGKDGEVGYTPSANADLYQFFSAGAIDGSVNCTYYLGPAGFPAFPVVTYTANGAAYAGNWNYGIAHVTTYPSGWSHVGTTAVCTLTGKMTLAFFYMYEGGATNTP